LHVPSHFPNEDFPVRGSKKGFLQRGSTSRRSLTLAVIALSLDPSMSLIL
jgi:hypothetical protein